MSALAQLWWPCARLRRRAFVRVQLGARLRAPSAAGRPQKPDGKASVSHHTAVDVPGFIFEFSSFSRVGDTDRSASPLSSISDFPANYVEHPKYNSGGGAKP